MAKDGELDKCMKLNLGCGTRPIPGWINLDSQANPGVDVVANLDQLQNQSQNQLQDSKLPFADESIDEFMMSHVLEHIAKPLPLFQELYRIAKPNARMQIQMPYGSSDDAWEDPTHVRAYFIGSFGYFTQPYYWRADYGYTADWQPQKIILFVRKNHHGNRTQQELHNYVMTTRNVVVEMHVELFSVKPARSRQKELQHNPEILFNFI